MSTGHRISEKSIAAQLPLEGDFEFWSKGSLQPWLDYRKLRFTPGKASLEKLFFRHAKPVWTWSEDYVAIPQNLFEIPYRWLGGISVFEPRSIEVAVWRLCEGCP